MWGSLEHAAVSSSTSETDVSTVTKKRIKGVRRPETYKFEVQKSKRLRGEEYVSVTTGTVVPAKSNNDRDCSCREMCTLMFSLQEREQCLNTLRGFKTKNDQDTFLMGLIDRKVPSRVRSKSKVQFKQSTFVYHAMIVTARLTVCRKAFSILYCIKNKAIFRLTSLIASGLSAVDNRGKHGHRGNAIPDNVRTLIDEHIEEFPFTEAYHFNKKIKCLSSDLNIKTLYLLFCKKHPNLADQVKYDFYRNYFNQNHDYVIFGCPQANSVRPFNKCNTAEHAHRQEGLRTKIRNPYFSEIEKNVDTEESNRIANCFESRACPGSPSENVSTVPKKKTKGVRHPETYKFVVQKNKRLRGEEYVSITTGALMPAKSNMSLDCSCRLMCTMKFNLQEKEQCLTTLYGFKTKNDQDTFLMGLIVRKLPSRRRSKSEVPLKRDSVFSYHVVKGTERVTVCRNAFSILYCIKSKALFRLTSLITAGMSAVDNRGRHSHRGNAIPEDARAMIDKHITELPFAKSHHSNKIKYLSAELNIKKLYKLFCEKHPHLADQVKYDFYRKYFKENHDYIVFGCPQTHECSNYEELRSKINSPYFSEMPKQAAAVDKMIHLCQPNQLYKQHQGVNNLCSNMSEVVYDFSHNLFLR
ncbi:hypothetical protein JTE90_011627 [Oedothorax gibbosus]|uniref:Uncharacterized protein n=1 Tax=Oedothorax gibbosus TaxID=931172 RepID=A0AAV6U3R4_9ARAC|nr:hypothetical protein JTE90_011627 [Oedothorax gibbosus]